jgi:hypothetical protein
MSFQSVTYNNGPLERGKDIVAYKLDELGEKSWIAVVAKQGDVTGGVADHHGITNVVNQVQQVFEHPYNIPRTATDVRISRCWVIASGRMLQQASDQLHRLMSVRPYIHGSTRWILGDDLVSLVGRYSPGVWDDLQRPSK